MLVIVPVFLYALFLDDLLRYKLEGQEAAVTTIWDYTVQDYGSPPAKGDDGGKFVGFGLVQGYARQMYCDHESGIDSFGPGKGPECEDDEEHHQSVVAHACWLNPGAQEVECQLGGGVGEYGVDQHQSYMSTYGRGGLIRCSARLGVQNYLLQHEFLTEFSNVDLAREKQDRGAGIHNNAKKGTYAGGTEGNIYLLPWERMSILTDTWALTRQVDIRPGQTSSEGPAETTDVAGAPDDLYERVLHLYEHQSNQGFQDMQSEAVDFVQEAIDDKLLADGMAITDSTPPGDDPRKPSIGMIPHREGAAAPEETIKQKGSDEKYFSSEWRDWGQDNNKRSYDARGNWYMGCNREESC
ncbi:hypothetical protein HPC49_38930 [Pyxidicoccus fallax]|uniref:Uncharacterized protein n=1 Tax=Pyxidicoccus fallax TaxID=394095 RepID=A0A848LXU3_9BACT|nr:hypothetical protein [Pyxidicoccus fallax]NMO22362.1 hypothetical protein [Pyxidicoccus fallax]NPC84174.1 hypothetical protein [Pyxidicoccus fallax]